MTDQTRAKLQFGLIFLAHALGAMSVLSVLTAGPQLVSALGLTALQLGGLASVYSAALAAASLPAGLVADRLGTRAALSLAALIISSGLVVSATSKGMVQLGTGLALCGAGYGLINPAAGLAIMLWFSPKWRTTLLSLKQTGVPAGAAIGSLTALLGPVWGWQAGIFCAAALAFSTGLLFVLFLPPKAAHVPPRIMSGQNKLAEVLALPGLGRANLVAGLTNGVQFALWAHIPDLLQRSYEAGAALLGLSLAALHLGTFSGRVVWGALTDRYLRGNAAHALWWLCLIGLAGAGALGAGTFIAHPFLAVAACFLLGLTACSAVGLHVALTARLAPVQLLGGAMGYTMLVTNLGGIIVPMLVGLAVFVAGMGGAALTLAVLMGTALALLRKFR
jgi:MFS family permease